MVPPLSLPILPENLEQLHMGSDSMLEGQVLGACKPHLLVILIT